LNRQLCIFKCFIILCVYGVGRDEAVLGLADFHEKGEVRQTCVAFFVFIVLVPLLPLVLLGARCGAAKRLAARPSGVIWDVLLQLAVPVAFGKLGDGAQTVENVVLRCGLMLLGPTETQVVQLGVDALLGGRLVAVGVQAVEGGPSLRGQHVQRDGSLVQAQLPPLHAADGRGALQLVVDLHAHAPTRLTELCSNVGLPLGCMRLDPAHLQPECFIRSRIITQC